VPYDEVYPRDFEDMQRRVPSSEKLKGLIDYIPDTDLDQILDDVIAYHQG
jgi:UDP-glucose 4-epimerase